LHVGVLADWLEDVRVVPGVERLPVVALEVLVTWLVERLRLVGA